MRIKWNFKRYWLNGLFVTSWLMLLTASFLPASTVQAARSIPASFIIPGMVSYAQQHYLSCEYAATRSALGHWGIQISEAEFINNIPRNNNPHLGFRGYIDGSWGGTYDYGIYAEPIARFLATRGVNTKLLWNGIEALKEEIALGRPVVVWINGLMWGNGQPFQSSQSGQSFQLMPYEHAMAVYGYDENGVYVADPGFGSHDYYSWAVFLPSWGYLGNMAMSVWPADKPAAADEQTGIATEFYRYWLQTGDVRRPGKPLASPARENGKVIQYFENARLEYDPDQPPTQPISRGLLGRELTTGRLAESDFLPLSAEVVQNFNSEEIGRYTPETGHLIDPEFALYWHSQGGVEIFGYPIARAYFENGSKIQHFERTRMELRSESGEAYKIIRLGQLGSERFSQLVTADLPPQSQDILRGISIIIQ